MKPRVLIVDDEANIRRMLRALLEAEGFDVAEAADGSRALDTFDRWGPNVLLLDLVMPPGPDGIETLTAIRQRHADASVVMMSGKATLSDAVVAARHGAFQFLEKPLTPEAVVVSVRAAVELSTIKAENRALHATRTGGQPIIGTSNAVTQMRRLIARVAQGATRVLITGESGTGKELVARAIHDTSDRRDRPFIGLNCAAIPHDLVESELFGHERGAFTGATSRRKGRFEMAHRGTLLLDEVSELSMPAQAKLLRALETGTIERVGGDRTIEVDTRIIAATNRDLERACRAGTFRSDLFFRLNVFPIFVPPLRNRRDDIPELIKHFSHSAATNCGVPRIGLSERAVQALRDHSWPGNIRELANVIERLTVLAGDGHAGPEDIARVLGTSGRAHAPSPLDAPRAAPTNLGDALAAYERHLIETALEQSSGNVAEAARRLVTDRGNLYRRMKRLGISSRHTSVSE